MCAGQVRLRFQWVWLSTHESFLLF